MRYDPAEAVATFQGTLGYRLDQFQVQSCEAVASGSSVLVAAPTGSGKTTVAEFAIHKCMQDADTKVFYTTPMKALSNQKFNELVAAYGEANVGLLTGDSNINSTARIVVMTTEVLRNMLYEHSESLTHLRYVVMDEVHYLADRFRGAVWEEVILHLPESVQLISLSATVSNAEEFGDWLQTVRGDTSVIVSETRPVPLHQHVYIQGDLIELFDPDSVSPVVNPEVVDRARLISRNESSARRGSRDRRGKRHNWRSQQRERPPSRSDVVRRLDEGQLLPAIYFIFSRAGCDAAVQNLARSGMRFTTAEEREQIRILVDDMLDELSDEDLATLGYWDWLESLQRGFASHHAGMLPAFKHIVEQLFQRKLIKVVFATETLALGINMPARTVVIEKLEKFNGEARVPLSAGEYTQLTGRAGRRGIDVEGHSVVLWSSSVDAQSLAQLASRRTYPLRSSFAPSYNMAVNLIQQHGRERTKHILESSFAQFQADRAVVELAKQLRTIEESLSGYSNAQRSSDQDEATWKRRSEKLEKEATRLRRQIQRRTESIARQFDRVVLILRSLGYLDDSDHVTAEGTVLQKIYGERDLLIAECLRRNVWRDLDISGLSALASTLVFEPRRDTGKPAPPPQLGSAFTDAYSETISLWRELDTLERDFGLSGTNELASGLAAAMSQWSRGVSLALVLDSAQIPAGDFVRWAKQTIDVLEQIAAHEEHSVAATARLAANSLKRGIVAI